MIFAGTLKEEEEEEVQIKVLCNVGQQKTLYLHLSELNVTHVYNKCRSQCFDAD